MNTMDLKNKVAIVTACTSGIGLSIALTLAQNSAKVYMAARNKQKADQIINDHKDLDLNFVYFDASDIESYKNFVNEVANKEGRLDILVNNFGGTDMNVDKTIFDTNYDDYIKIVNENLASIFIPSQQAVNVMKHQGFGSIINISSIGSLVPDVTRIAYSTTKSMINSLSQNMAVQVAKYGIRVNAVLPGMTNTNAVSNNLPKEFLTEFLKNVPIGRIGEPEDISNMVLFLASDLSTYITGEIISVAGGFGKPTPLYAMMYSKK